MSPLARRGLLQPSRGYMLGVAHECPGRIADILYPLVT